MPFQLGVALACALAASPSDDAEQVARSAVVIRRTITQGWLVRETANFCITTWNESPGVGSLPAQCEELRERLCAAWLGETPADWSCKCDVIVYPTTASYVRQLGPGSEQSSGCTSLKLHEGRVTVRRIDLRGDAVDWFSAALPHELTHAIVADRFSRTQIPRWADEGMSILAEPHDKQQRRHRQLEAAISSGGSFRAADLVAVRQYPTGPAREAFYGQSAALVHYLIERDSPSVFLDFVVRAERRGYDRALHDVYGIRSLADLDQRWGIMVQHRRHDAADVTRLVAEVTSPRLRDGTRTLPH